MKMSFLSHANKTCIHRNGFALGLGLKRRLRVTRKWDIFNWLKPLTFAGVLFQITVEIKSGILIDWGGDAMQYGN